MSDRDPSYSDRESILASRHRALGSTLDDWCGMGTAWSYDADACDEHDAIREAAGLFDVSGLRKFWVTGPDAQAAVDHAITRDLTKIVPGQSVYALVLTEDGKVTDDCIVACFSNEKYLVAHGSGHCQDMIEKSAAGKDVKVEFDDSIQDLAFQGPKSYEILNPHTPTELSELKYFHQVETTLFGHDVIISRTGYSGELGFEIYSKRENMPEIWDTILDLGKDKGVVPCSFDCLDKIRVEAALLFYPYDMHEEISPWGLGVDFAISRNEGDFRGKEALFAAEGKNKIEVIGLIVDHDDAAEEQAELHLNGEKVGVINSPVWSHRMNKSIALGHIDPAHAAPGTKLDVRGNMNTTAVIHSLPFYDPEKKKPRTI